MVLPEDGVGWLTSRRAPKQMKDGKSDIDVQLRDLDAELVAIGYRVAMIWELACCLASTTIPQGRPHIGVAGRIPHPDVHELLLSRIGSRAEEVAVVAMWRYNCWECSDVKEQDSLASRTSRSRT